MIKQFYFTYKKQGENLLIYNKTTSTAETSSVDLIDSNYFLEKVGSTKITGFEIQGPPSTEYEVIYKIGEEDIQAPGLLDASGIINWDIKEYGFIKTIKIKKLPIIEDFSSLKKYSQELLVTFIY